MNANLSTTSNWLQSATHMLENENIGTARLDCLVLLEDVTGKDRSYLLAHDEDELDSKAIQKLNKQIVRRAKHEPLAYIRGKSEFYGREFMVNKHTLEPRPETETMITLLIQILNSQKPPLQKVKPLTEKGNEGFGVVDVGVGSGCIGITVKLEIPELKVVGTDISGECIKVVRGNAKKLGADITFYKGNLLEPVKDRIVDILLCNLPYVPDSHAINQAAMQEPKIAIFGGSDGLDLYREMFEQVKAFGLKPLFILTESLPFQHDELAKIAKHYGYNEQTRDDFIQAFILGSN